MYEVVIYKDRHGNEPIADYIRELSQKAETNKDSRIRYKKILEYLAILRRYGTRVGEPYVKSVDGIWELRPTNDRIFFAYWEDNQFILLHHFIKKSQMTPRREIEKAKNNLADFLERSKQDE